MATVCTVIALAACVAFIGVVVAAAIIDLRTLHIPNGLLIFAVVIWIAEHISLFILSGAYASLTDMFGYMGLSGEGLRAAFFSVANFSSGFGSHAPNFGSSLIGAVLLGGGAYVVSRAYEAVSHKPSMGAGDIKLLLVAGLYLGWWRGLFCVIIACIAFLVTMALLPRMGWQPEEAWIPLEDCYKRTLEESEPLCTRNCEHFEKCFHAEGCVPEGVALATASAGTSLMGGENLSSGASLTGGAGLSGEIAFSGGAGTAEGVAFSGGTSLAEGALTPGALVESASHAESASHTESTSQAEDFAEGAYGLPFAPAIAFGALAALVLM